MSGAIRSGAATGNMEVERGNSGFNVAILNMEVNRYQFHATFADTITRHMVENIARSSTWLQTTFIPRH